MILRATRRDTRFEDMHDLVLSASAPDIKERIGIYLESIKPGNSPG